MDTYVGEGAFAPLGYGEGVLIPAEAVGCTQGNGWVEIDYNIAENALRGVALGRKNWLFAGSDAGGERASVLYSLIGTCRLNGVDPGAWLRYVIGNIQEWPVNRLRHLLPWKIDLTPAVSAEI